MRCLARTNRISYTTVNFKQAWMNNAIELNLFRWRQRTLLKWQIQGGISPRKGWQFLLLLNITSNAIIWWIYIWSSSKRLESRTTSTAESFCFWGTSSSSPPLKILSLQQNVQACFRMPCCYLFQFLLQYRPRNKSHEILTQFSLYKTFLRFWGASSTRVLPSFFDWVAWFGPRNSMPGSVSAPLRVWLHMLEAATINQIHVL